MAGDDRVAGATTRLAIVIPAFGRAAPIAASIAAMAEEARAGGLAIAFYVSDDTPDDSVETALVPLIAAGVPLHYRRNRPSLGHDRNVIASLTWPDADYVWPIGSNYRAAAGILSPVVAFLDGQDLIFLNNHAPEEPCAPCVEGEAARRLIVRTLWHQTLTGTTVYARRVCDWVAARDGGMRLVANFPQISAILGFGSDHDVSVGWFERLGLESAWASEGSYWQARAIDIFARDWGEAVAAFPAVVLPRDRAWVTRAHSARTNLFNTAGLMAMRRNGQFRWASLADARVRRAMHLPRWKLFLLLALPLPVLRLGSAGLASAKRRLR